MPLMRDITCVTSSNSSRDRQRSTAAAGSSPMLSRTIAACSTGDSGAPSIGSPSIMLLSSAIFLHPLFDDFGDAFGFFLGQHLQVVDHDVDGRAGRRQIIIFQQGHHRHATAAGGRRCAARQRAGRVGARRGQRRRGVDGGRGGRIGGAALGGEAGGGGGGRRRRQLGGQQAQQRAQQQQIGQQAADGVQQPGAGIDDGVALLPPRRDGGLGREGHGGDGEVVAALAVYAQAVAQHLVDVGDLGG